MHKSLVSRPLSDLYALKTKKKMKTKALLKGAFVFTSWTKFYLLYENYDCKIKISIYLTIYFLRTSTSVAISENTRPLYIKKKSRGRGNMALSVFMCVCEGERLTRIKITLYIYSKLINLPIVEIDIYTSQDRYVVHFFLHFLCFHIIVIPFFSNGIKTCIYMYKSIQIHVCRTFLFTLFVLSTYL